MPFPTGVSLAEVRLPASATWQGGASTITATLTPTRSVIHRSSNTPLTAVSGTATGPSGAGLVLLVPHSQQSNFRDAAGNSIASWEYDMVVTYRDTANVLRTVTKQVRIPRSTAVLDVLTAVDYGPAKPLAEINVPPRLAEAALNATIDTQIAASPSVTGKLSASTAASTYTTLAGAGAVLVLGDSIAAAYGATSAPTAYPAQIAVALKPLGLNATIVPAGVSGDTTYDMLARLPALLTANNPGVVTIQASINDARLDRSVTSQQTADNVRQMVALVRKRGAEAFVIGAAPIDPVWFNNAASYSILSAIKAVTTNSLVKQLCAELGVPYIDIFSEMLGRVGVLADGIHPNNAGHAVWARAVAAAIADRTLRSTKKTLFSDGFDRPNSATTLGAQWTAQSGVWGVTGNAAYAVAPADGQLASADAGFPNVVVRAKQTTDVTARPVSVIARMTDANNHYLADTNPNTEVVTLYKRVAGTYTALATIGQQVDGLSDELIFVADGTHLMVYLNGSPVVDVTDSTFTAGNLVGVRQSGVNAMRWDAFTVTA